MEYYRERTATIDEIKKKRDELNKVTNEFVKNCEKLNKQCKFILTKIARNIYKSRIDKIVKR